MRKVLKQFTEGKGRNLGLILAFFETKTKIP